MNLTPVFSKANDVLREVFFGNTARLILMTHAQTGGYTKALEITNGWLIEDPDAGGGESVGALKLEVAESLTITAAMLADCAGFALLRAGENAAEARFLKVVERKQPLEEFSLVWIMLVTPTRERVSI